MTLQAQFLQFLLAGVTVGSIYALIALGFVTIYNVTGIINFAQGEFVMLGGMLSVWLLGHGLPLPVAVLAACLATAAVGGLMERLAMRPLAGAPAINAVIITIGVSIPPGASAFTFDASSAKLQPRFCQLTCVAGSTTPEPNSW